MNFKHKKYLTFYRRSKKLVDNEVCQEDSVEEMKTHTTATTTIYSEVVPINTDYNTIPPSLEYVELEPVKIVNEKNSKDCVYLKSEEAKKKEDITKTQIIQLHKIYTKQKQHNYANLNKCIVPSEMRKAQFPLPKSNENFLCEEVIPLPYFKPSQTFKIENINQKFKNELSKTIVGKPSIVESEYDNCTRDFKTRRL